MSVTEAPSLPTMAKHSVGKPRPGELKFGTCSDFHQELRRRVDAHFAQTGRRRRDCPAMYRKTAIIMAWFAASYAALVFLQPAWWLALPLAVSLGLAMAAIGFNIQHDGGHHAYSDRSWVNRLMAMTLDMLGGSSYMWARKHNTIHHSYSNITGHDDDINIGALGRLTPHQPRFGFHRFQHLYLWALYGLLPIKWQLFDDYRDVAIGRIGEHRVARPRGWDLTIFIAGKLLFLTLAFVIPLLYHPLWAVLAIYALTSFAQGVVLSIVFQMAHCVDEAAFPMPREDTGRIESAWAIHQVETTVNFARGNPVVSWFVGGLNYQIEHHLLPRICHVNYPELAPIVEQTCADFGVRYFAHDTFAAGLLSHYRWLRRMGMPAPA